jgi:Enoyl-(Acyl carrier protein) reductase
VIATPLFDKLGLSKATVEEISKSLMAAIPVKRFGTPEEAAKAVLFLASTDASYIPGLNSRSTAVGRNCKVRNRSHCASDAESAYGDRDGKVGDDAERLTTRWHATEA